MPASSSDNRSLLLLVFSQFAGTSVWFAGNAIADKIAPGSGSAGMTTFVQFGFIAGTLVFSLFTIADRYPAKAVFFFSALLAAAANGAIVFIFKFPPAISLLRFATGFFLAGIYPVGMKIAADVFPKKLGKALGWLVGALVLGTAFPHLVRSQLGGLNWKTVVVTSSLLAATGGFVVFFFLPPTKKPALLSKPDFAAAFTVFRYPAFRSAAFGYFGHMWELYAFWAILPALFSAYQGFHHLPSHPFGWSFASIGIGSIGCVAGGWLSLRRGSRTVAVMALLLSFCCCLVAPLAFLAGPVVFYSFVLLWGFVVIPDSPQFSALVAGAAGEKVKGTALTVVTCIGFAITIASIQLLKELFSVMNEKALWILAPGPLLGLLALRNRK
ncbi:MFS transporter [Flavisolibacter nicotianae]|uniref:MFS transporter n=1 Tax=Flavisolibacter nicotianae TaxID=2364882 RepID=UPI000EB513E8|nr:MFS transporter [Flavisolibacter nicotianae]